jgi:hypothetical protein
MAVRPIRKAALLCVSMYLAACGSGPQLGRLGQPVPLPNGQPRSACEHERWYEIVPTRISTHAIRPVGYVGTRYGGYVRTENYARLHEGLGVYRIRSVDPEDLEDVWPRLQEPELYRVHQARIEPVDDANAKATWWAVGGLVGLVAGIGTAAAIQDQTGTGAAIAGISGLTIGLTGAIGALVISPSAQDEMDADARRQLFFEGEDDLRAVARGVDRSNAQTRSACERQPAPSAPP